MAVGEVGEIIVSGPVVMQGYWNQPDLTAEALRGGYMHTGDLGRMDVDGFVYVVDRIKDVPVAPNGLHQHVPVTAVVVQKALLEP